MPYCIKCGKIVNNDDNYCKNCGKPLQVTRTNYNVKSRSNRLFIILFFIMIVIATILYRSELEAILEQTLVRAIRRFLEAQ